MDAADLLLRHSRVPLLLTSTARKCGVLPFVIPAKAGTQKRLPPLAKPFFKGPEGPFWIPACAGKTEDANRIPRPDGFAAFLMTSIAGRFT